MAGGIVQGIGPGGVPVAIGATAAGRLETDASGGGGDGATMPELLMRLVWELAELRRVTCEASGEFFRDYPGD